MSPNTSNGNINLPCVAKKKVECVTCQSWSWFENCSESLVLASRKSYLVIICPNSNEYITKVKLGQIGVDSNIAQNLAPRKSYVITNGPTLHEKFTKSVIRSSWSWFEHFPTSLIQTIRSHFWSFIIRRHSHVKLTKSVSSCRGCFFIQLLSCI